MPPYLGNQQVWVIANLSLHFQECLDHKDFLNHQYLRKRALYLTYIAANLKKSADIEDLQFTYHHGNYMKPILVVAVKGNIISYVTPALKKKQMGGGRGYYGLLMAAYKRST